MNKLMLTIALIMFSASIQAQQDNFRKPDYDLIRKGIFDNNSPFFYPTLFDRYQNGDTTLTIEDFMYLYYGYTFQSRYIPYQESRYQDKILSYIKKGTLSSKELDEFIKIAELNLKDLPFDIRTLHILVFSYSQKKDSLMSAITSFKKEMLLKTILSTGDGKTERTAFHVIDPAHEFDILNEMGLKFAGTSNLTNALCDYLLVSPNEKNIRGYYFDISRILKVKAVRQN
jgi:hypothetical protein